MGSSQPSCNVHNFCNTTFAVTKSGLINPKGSYKRAMTASTRRFVYYSEFSSVDGEPLFEFVE
jgi:hypothetical protein